MSLKASGPGEVHEIDRFDGGAGWLAHPGEPMQRASHALATDEGLWVVDPVDADGLDEFLAELGEVTGVVVLLDRHTRDAAAVARRHDVPVYLPRFMTGVDVDAPTAVLGDELGGRYAVHRLVDNPFWKEAALHDGETLLVPESLGTVGFMTTGDERLGVHPMRRLTPPRTLRALPAERVLVGHGAGVHADAAAAVRDAVDGSVRRAPALYARTLREALPV